MDEAMHQATVEVHGQRACKTLSQDFGGVSFKHTGLH